MERIVYILRAVPGAGKSTLANVLAGDSGEVCEADAYLYDKDGKYVWTEERVLMAHRKCEDAFKKALEAGTSPIIVSNTNTKLKDVNYYRHMAISAGYKVFVMVLENHHNGKDTHSLSEEKLKDMEQRIRSNIKLR